MGVNQKNFLDKTKGIDWDSAQKMFADIECCNNLKDYFRENEDKFIDFDLPSLMNALIDKSDFSRTELIKQTNIEKSYFYQILNGRRKPSRSKLLKIAIALKLDLGVTQRLLVAADRSILYPIKKRDAAIVCCLNNQYNLHKTQIFLHDMDIELLD